MMQATSAGMKEQEAINFLEKKMKENPAFTYDETVQVEVTTDPPLLVFCLYLSGDHLVHYF